MMTEITFLKKALPGGCKSWQRPVHLNRGLSEKKNTMAAENHKAYWASKNKLRITLFSSFLCLLLDDYKEEVTRKK